MDPREALIRILEANLRLSIDVDFDTHGEFRDELYYSLLDYAEWVGKGGCPADNVSIEWDWPRK